MWPSIVPPNAVPTPSPLNEIKLALQPSGEEEGGGPGGRGGQAPARAAGGRLQAGRQTVGPSSGSGLPTWQLQRVLHTELVSPGLLLLGSLGGLHRVPNCVRGGEHECD